jgi:hypothetical protein
MQLVINTLQMEFYAWVDEYGPIGMWAENISVEFEDARTSINPGELRRWRASIQERLVEGKRLLCELKAIFVGSTHADSAGLSIIGSQVFELTTEIQSAISCVYTMLIYLTGSSQS